MSVEANSTPPAALRRVPPLRLTRRNLPLAGAGVLLFAALTFALSRVLSDSIGVDWYVSWRPAALELASLRSPYTILYRNPFWALLPVIPLALLPPTVGHAAFLIISVAAFVFIAYRLGASPIVMLFFLLSPPVLHSLVNANNDWLALLGFAFPPQIGLLFLVIKPQIGAAAVIYWLIESWRRGGIREVIRVFWPVASALAVSFLLFGNWLRSFEGATDLWWNASLFPASIPVGLGLLAASLRTRKIEYSMAASPCLSPYVLLHAWAGALAALMRSPAEMVAAVVGLWILVLMQLDVLPF